LGILLVLVLALALDSFVLILPASTFWMLEVLFLLVLVLDFLILPASTLQPFIASTFWMLVVDSCPFVVGKSAMLDATPQPALLTDH
jgi:hypothetical protein